MYSGYKPAPFFRDSPPQIQSGLFHSLSVSLFTPNTSQTNDDVNDNVDLKKQCQCPSVSLASPLLVILPPQDRLQRPLLRLLQLLLPPVGYLPSSYLPPFPNPFLASAAADVTREVTTEAPAVTTPQTTPAQDTKKNADVLTTTRPATTQATTQVAAANPSTAAAVTSTGPAVPSVAAATSADPNPIVAADPSSTSTQVRFYTKSKVSAHPLLSNSPSLALPRPPINLQARLHFLLPPPPQTIAPALAPSLDMPPQRLLVSRLSPYSPSG